MSLARGLCFVCRFGACWYQENTHQTHLLSKWEDGPTQIHFGKLSNPNCSHQGHQPTVKKHLQLRFSSSKFNICPPLLQFQPVSLPWLHLPRGNAMGGTMLATVREWFYISTLTSTSGSVCIRQKLNFCSNSEALQAFRPESANRREVITFLFPWNIQLFFSRKTSPPMKYQEATNSARSLTCLLIFIYILHSLPSVD